MDVMYDAMYVHVCRSPFLCMWMYVDVRCMWMYVDVRRECMMQCMCMYAAVHSCAHESALEFFDVYGIAHVDQLTCSGQL